MEDPHKVALGGTVRYTHRGGKETPACVKKVRDLGLVDLTVDVSEGPPKQFLLVVFNGDGAPGTWRPAEDAAGDAMPTDPPNPG